jgi:hypothetical protein
MVALSCRVVSMRETTKTTIANMQAAARAFIADPSAVNETAVRETSAVYGMSARMIEDRVRGLRASAVNGVPAEEACTRCGGTGHYMNYGVCFGCDGSGKKESN